MDTQINLYKTNEKWDVQNACKAVPKSIQVWAKMHTKSSCGETLESSYPKHRWTSYISYPNHMQIKITFIILIGM